MVCMCCCLMIVGFLLLEIQVMLQRFIVIRVLLDTYTDIDTEQEDKNHSKFQFHQWQTILDNGQAINQKHRGKRICIIGVIEYFLGVVSLYDE